MRTLLICHDGAALTQDGLARWLASFSELTGILVLRESPGRRWQRVRREIRHSGPIDRSGRRPRTWGAPRLTSDRKLRQHARRGVR